MAALTHLQRLEAESLHVLREVVAECERPDRVDREVRLDDRLVLLARLVGHPLDAAAQLRVEVVAVDPTGGLAQVAAEIGRPLDLRRQLQR